MVTKMLCVWVHTSAQLYLIQSDRDLYTSHWDALHTFCNTKIYRKFVRLNCFFFLLRFTWQLIHDWFLYFKCLIPIVIRVYNIVILYTSHHCKCMASLQIDPTASICWAAERIFSVFSLSQKRSLHCNASTGSFFSLCSLHCSQPIDP